MGGRLTVARAEATGEQEAGGPITITDHADREVTIEGPVEKIFGAGPPATTMLYTFSPDLLAGWNSDTSEAMAEYIPQEYLDLPVLGRGFGNEGTINPEVLLQGRSISSWTRGRSAPSTPRARMRCRGRPASRC